MSKGFKGRKNLHGLAGAGCLTDSLTDVCYLLIALVIVNVDGLWNTFLALIVDNVIKGSLHRPYLEFVENSDLFMIECIDLGEIDLSNRFEMLCPECFRSYLSLSSESLNSFLEHIKIGGHLMEELDLWSFSLIRDVVNVEVINFFFQLNDLLANCCSCSYTIGGISLK